MGMGDTGGLMALTGWNERCFTEWLFLVENISTDSASLSGDAILEIVSRFI